LDGVVEGGGAERGEQADLLGSLIRREQRVALHPTSEHGGQLSDALSALAQVLEAQLDQLDQRRRERHAAQRLCGRRELPAPVHAAREDPLAYCRAEILGDEEGAAARALHEEAAEFERRVG